MDDLFHGLGRYVLELITWFIVVLILCWGTSLAFTGSVVLTGILFVVRVFAGIFFWNGLGVTPEGSTSHSMSYHDSRRVPRKSNLRPTKKKRGWLDAIDDAFDGGDDD